MVEDVGEKCTLYLEAIRREAGCGQDDDVYSYRSVMKRKEKAEDRLWSFVRPHSCRFWPLRSPYRYLGDPFSSLRSSFLGCTVKSSCQVSPDTWATSSYVFSCLLTMQRVKGYWRRLQLCCPEMAW